MELRPEVQAFAEAMEERLRANDSKGGWQSEPVDWLLERLVDEVEELWEAAMPNCKCREASCHHWNFPSKQAVLRETTDVANFALMIADVCGGLRKEADDARS